MPLLPSATLIATPGRAVQLFPPVKCHQCDGRTTVERLGRKQCPACSGTGYIPGTEEFCPDCQPNGTEKGTGVLTFPEKIPCPRCNGKGATARVSEVRPGTLAAIKAGDWVIVGVEFPGLPVADTPAGTPYQNATAELIPCIVARAQAGGRVMARVMKAPDYSDSHGLRYGDTLEFGPNQILQHTVASPEEFEKARNGGLLTATPLSAMAPEAGKAYYARNGANCLVWTKRVDQTGEYYLGAADGATAEWHTDGAGRGGRRDLDLVAPKQVVNT